MRDGGCGMRSPPRRHRIPHPASRIPPVPLTVPAPKRTRSSVPSAAAVSDPRRATARGAGRPWSTTRATATPAARASPRDPCVSAWHLLSVSDLWTRDGSVRSVILRMLVALVALATVASTADAQRRARRGQALIGAPRPSVGFRIGYDFDADHTFFGGQLNLPVGRRWTLVPSAELYLGVTGTPYRLNADLKYPPPTALGLFYFGGGFAYFHASGGGDAGGNVFAGWEGRRAMPFKPFLEARLVCRDNTSFNVLGGLSVPL